ncbi:hypothetical protein ACFLRO_02120 [Bacteroidota bacterium]
MLSRFDRYEIGKRSLINLRSSEDVVAAIGELGYGDVAGAEGEIRDRIRENGQAKTEYEHLLTEIALDFRRKLGTAT